MRWLTRTMICVRTHSSAPSVPSRNSTISVSIKSVASLWLVSTRS
jgi:hypothetical protein